jgi:hypothetical protein
MNVDLYNIFYLKERKMKKVIMILVLSMSITGLNFSQENNGTNLYTLFFNVVNE